MQVRLDALLAADPRRLSLEEMMAIAKIEVRKSRSANEITDIIDAVYQAFRKTLKVLEGDSQIRYIEHKPEHFAVPPGNPEN